MNLHKRPDELEEQHLHLLSETDDFNYAALDCKTRIVVQQRTREIKERLEDAVQAIWQIGQKLVEVRNCLSYGQFTCWLKTEFQWSRSTAYNYINVFETFGSCPNFGQLNIAPSALYLLAAPSTCKEAREEALESAKLGETVTYSKAKAIVGKHKKSSQPKNDNQSIDIDPCIEPLESKSSAAVKPDLNSDVPLYQLDKPDTTVEIESLEQLGENINQSQVDDCELGTHVCDLLRDNTVIEKLSSEELAATAIAKSQSSKFLDFDTSCFGHLRTQPISMNTDDICLLLIVSVNYLTDEQIMKVWEAIAHRIPCELRSSPIEID
ncbi:hypothetical protein NIES4103_24010 [Nostoc sp. NIES-4103]|nr:hypothetical protein NIES4103_24010 [Nostoc sp. NIES-4103]